MATHSSILAGTIPWTGEPGKLQIKGSQTVMTEHSNFTSIFKKHIHTIIYKIENQQGPTVQHKELYSILCNSLYGKEVEKEQIYPCAALCLVTQSCPTLCNPHGLCSLPGTLTTGILQARILE